MRATIFTLLKRPPVIIGFAACLIISLFALNGFGFTVWKRFVAPTEIMLTAYLVWRIAEYSQIPAFKSSLLNASRSLATAGACITIGAVLDAVLWPHLGFLTFIGIVTLWAWITIRAAHIENALRQIHENERQRSGEITPAQLAANIEAVMIAGNTLLERYNVEAGPRGWPQIPLSHPPHKATIH